MDVQSQETAIRIGDVDYSVDVSKIPYLSHFVSFQRTAKPGSSEFVHDEIPLFDVALKGVESGYRHCFRSLPADLSQTRTLCETYEFLCVDVLGGKPITAIIDGLKAGKTDYELEYKRYIPVKGNKSKARDMALVLVYLILLGEFTDEAKDTARIYNAVLFVVSHSGTFKWKTRKIVRAAYEDRFVVSSKQMATLDKWNKEAVEEGDDVTTEEEDHDDYYGSDGYDGYDEYDS
ncbi:hypothetical protein BLS_006253 [Venturia inaequalis]|uniref:Uncharacterized protein n=1 Tax=Venturia inaequalis TaxID=5025 RepID=A0A8H3YNY7_VENIN|nr:hypothetical protein BLS_006253 [Venturia inaequalis]KAE9989004.1 hypothetical protein EG328_003320 [Venturia inaequalis]RDI80460.1 hypothetical protein Vi05172_g9505 [Venturia inaequalis]